MTDVIVYSCVQILRLNILRILKVRPYILNQSLYIEAFCGYKIYSFSSIASHRVYSTAVSIIKHTHFRYLLHNKMSFLLVSSAAVAGKTVRSKHIFKYVISFVITVY
jgi:hypothetical protein